MPDLGSGRGVDVVGCGRKRAKLPRLSKLAAGGAVDRGRGPTESLLLRVTSSAQVNAATTTSAVCFEGGLVRTGRIRAGGRIILRDW